MNVLTILNIRNLKNKNIIAIISLSNKAICNREQIRQPASEVSKSTIQEGPQYSIYKKRDQIWYLKLQNSFQ